jgi:hypothetical protein
VFKVILAVFDDLSEDLSSDVRERDSSVASNTFHIYKIIRKCLLLIYKNQINKNGGF